MNYLILFVLCLLGIGHQSDLFAAESSEEIPGIELPPLETDEDKIAFLIWVKKRIPALFSDAAQYDINLLDILDDQKKLVDQLRKIPGYEDGFRKRKFVELTVTPPQEGLSVNEVKLKDGVVDDWKESLSKRLDQWSRSRTIDSGRPLLDQMKDDLLAQDLLENPDKKKAKGTDPTTKVMAIIQNNGILKRQYDKEPKPSGDFLSRLRRMNEIIKNNPEAFKIKENPKKQDLTADDLAKIETLLSQEEASAESEKLKQKDLMELYLALGHAVRHELPGQNPFDLLASAKASLSTLTENDLLYFDDKNDVLIPEISKILKNAKNLYGAVHQNILYYTSQTDAM